MRPFRDNNNNMVARVLPIQQRVRALLFFAKTVNFFLSRRMNKTYVQVPCESFKSFVASIALFRCSLFNATQMSSSESIFFPSVPFPQWVLCHL